MQELMLSGLHAQSGLVPLDGSGTVSLPLHTAPGGGEDRGRGGASDSPPAAAAAATAVAAAAAAVAVEESEPPEGASVPAKGEKVKVMVVTRKAPAAGPSQHRTVSTTAAGKRASGVVDHRRQREAAVRTIQRHARGFLAREEQDLREVSAEQIQAAYRGYQLRQLFDDAKYGDDEVAEAAEDELAEMGVDLDKLSDRFLKELELQEEAEEAAEGVGSQ
jgi:transcriptional regulator of met regulon